MRSVLAACLLAASLVTAPAAHAVVSYDWTTASVTGGLGETIDQVSLGRVTFTDESALTGHVLVQGLCDNPFPGCTSTIGDINQITFESGLLNEASRVRLFLDVDVLLNTDDTLTGSILFSNRSTGFFTSGDGLLWQGVAGADDGACFLQCQYTGYWTRVEAVPEPNMWPMMILLGAAAVVYRRRQVPT